MGGPRGPVVRGVGRVYFRAFACGGAEPDGVLGAAPLYSRDRGPTGAIDPYRDAHMSSFFAALGIVFLAELGDKTQIVALGFGARYRLRTVLAGVAAGYMASMLLSVVIGGLLGAALPTDAIAIGGGLLFVAFAIVSLLSARNADNGDDEDLLDELGLEATGSATRRASRRACRTAACA